MLHCSRHTAVVKQYYELIEIGEVTEDKGKEYGGRRSRRNDAGQEDVIENMHACKAIQ